MRSKNTNVNFAGQTIYVGIDVHKKSWSVTLRSEHYHLNTFSQDPDVDLLVNYLNRTYPGAYYKAVYEAGFSGFGACRRLLDQCVDCKVVHPMDIPRSNKDKVMKTDAIDSRKLCSLLLSKDQEYIHIPDEELECDRALVRQRYRIARDLARTKNRLKSLFFQLDIKLPEEFEGMASRNWSRKYLEWVANIEVVQPTARLVIDRYIELGKLQKEQLKACKRTLIEVSKKLRYKQDCELLCTIPGISLLTAMTFVLQLGDLRRFKTLDKLCFYVGLVPKVHSSGESVRTGKMIKRGRRALKVHLIECAWMAIRKDPALTLKFNELALKMNKNKAIIRIARKILSRIRYVLLNKEPYRMGIVQ
ncbi:MAG: IS110 family transposase [Bacteroidota bacterium]